MAKTLYHSELVKMGPVKVTVKSDVLPSKFQGKPPYLELLIGNNLRQYSTENNECADFFQGQKGRSFTIVAEGSREQAIITYVGEAAPDPEPEQQPARQPAKAKSNRPPAQPPASGSNQTANRPPPQQAPPPEQTNGQHAEAAARTPAPRQVETPEEKIRRAKEHANKVANVWLIAFRAGLYAREQIRSQLNQELGEQQFQACVSTIAVQLEKDGFHHQMPVGILDLGTAPQPAKTEKPKPADQPA